MMKIAKGALSMLLSIVLVVGLFPNLAYAVGPASAKSEEQGPARPAPEVPVTEELVVPTSGNVSFELAEDNSLSKQASAGGLPPQSCLREFPDEGPRRRCRRGSFL